VECHASIVRFLIKNFSITYLISRK